MKMKTLEKNVQGCQTITNTTTCILNSYVVIFLYFYRKPNLSETVLTNIK